MSAPELTTADLATPPYRWGIDVGGTGIKIGLVDDSGATLAYESIRTHADAGPDAAVARIANSCRGILDRLELPDAPVSAGVGSPGPMDLKAGTLVSPPQLPTWWGFNLRDAVSDALGLPVAFLNDANAAAYGEFWGGAGRDDDSLVMLTLGTGVGAGIIVDGHMINGENSCGSECGHMIVDPSPDALNCHWGGGRGQLEAYASASGVVIRTRRRLEAGVASELSAHGDDLTAKHVHTAATHGDPLALQIVDETAFWLGIAVTSLVYTVDPGAVVLGGAMNFGGGGDAVGERFIAAIREEFRVRTFPALADHTTIKFATLRGHAGYLGVAGYAKKIYQ